MKGKRTEKMKIKSSIVRSLEHIFFLLLFEFVFVIDSFVSSVPIWSSLCNAIDESDFVVVKLTQKKRAKMNLCQSSFFAIVRRWNTNKTNDICAHAISYRNQLIHSNRSRQSIDVLCPSQKQMFAIQSNDTQAFLFQFFSLFLLSQFPRLPRIKLNFNVLRNNRLVVAGYSMNSSQRRTYKTSKEKSLIFLKVVLVKRIDSIVCFSITFSCSPELSFSFIFFVFKMRFVWQQRKSTEKSNRNYEILDRIEILVHRLYNICNWTDQRLPIRNELCTTEKCSNGRKREWIDSIIANN